MKKSMTLFLAATAASLSIQSAQARTDYPQDRRSGAVGSIGEAGGSGAVGSIDDANGGSGTIQDEGPADPYGEVSHQKAEALARLLYKAILFREGEFTGVLDNADAIVMHGVGPVAGAIASSEEFRTNVLPRRTPEQIVRNLYLVLLGRPAEPAGLQYWSQIIRSGNAVGAIQSIADSAEFRARHGLR